MTQTRDYLKHVMDYINHLLRRPRRLDLGGGAGEEGGTGFPPGGITGQLSQRYICYDTTEATTAGSTASSGSRPSLVQNLNRIRGGWAIGDEAIQERHMLWSTGCLPGTSGCISARDVPFFTTSDLLSDNVREAIEEVYSGTAFGSGVIRYYVWTVSSDVEVVVGGLRLRTSGSTTFSPTLARAEVNAAPTGADMLIDVNVNGASVWADPNDRLTIADGTNTDSSPPDTVTIDSDDYMTIDVDQVGSTNPGSELVVIVEGIEVRTL
jgi:hypothetical protein